MLNAGWQRATPAAANVTTNAGTVLNLGAWTGVGSADFSAGATEYQSLSFAPDGTPYVAYMDFGNNYKATVMRFNGTSWVTVGSVGFSEGEAFYESLSFAPDGSPYLAYEDTGNNYKATVMRFSGTT